MRGSRDRGCKGHRILRMVLVDGRHLGTSRAIGFHESMVKAALAAPSREKAIRPRACSTPKLMKAGRRLRRNSRNEKRKTRQRCQRLDRSRRRGKKRPRSHHQEAGDGD